jgi:hypothetical protein
MNVAVMNVNAGKINSDKECFLCNKVLGVRQSALLGPEEAKIREILASKEDARGIRFDQVRHEHTSLACPFARHCAVQGRIVAVTPRVALNRVECMLAKKSSEFSQGTQTDLGAEEMLAPLPEQEWFLSQSDEAKHKAQCDLAAQKQALILYVAQATLEDFEELKRALEIVAAGTPTESAVASQDEAAPAAALMIDETEPAPHQEEPEEEGELFGPDPPCRQLAFRQPSGSTAGSTATPSRRASRRSREEATLDENREVLLGGLDAAADFKADNMGAPGRWTREFVHHAIGVVSSLRGSLCTMQRVRMCMEEAAEKTEREKAAVQKRYEEQMARAEVKKQQLMKAAVDKMMMHK